MAENECPHIDKSESTWRCGLNGIELRALARNCYNGAACQLRQERAEAETARLRERIAELEAARLESVAEIEYLLNALEAMQELEGVGEWPEWANLPQYEKEDYRAAAERIIREQEKSRALLSSAGKDEGECYPGASLRFARTVEDDAKPKVQKFPFDSGEKSRAALGAKAAPEEGEDDS